MMILSRTHRNILLLTVFLLGSAWIFATRATPAQLPGSVAAFTAATTAAPIADHPAPDFTLTNLSGEPVTLSELHGQVVLINLWATWCGPCRAEMPAIQAVYAEYQPQGFTVLAVNAREEPQTVSAFMDEYNLSFPALLDPTGDIHQDYRAMVLPSSFLIDRQGIIRAVYRGPISHNLLATVVAQLLHEEPAG